ncbi:hypothetical protein BVX97_05405 [bacterium E08(2017)]|nr:hypothetical protein BVX97_05405 [bacterium E08(2017)]
MWVPISALLILLLPERKRLIVPFLSGILLGTLLSAPQLSITYHATLDSYRAGGLPFAEAAERSFHPLRLIELGAPYIFGSHSGWYVPALFGEGATKLSPWIGSFHIGALSLIPLALAWRKRGEPIVKWAAASLVISLLLSFGRFTPLFSIWRLLPVVEGFRYPEKYLLWSTLSLSILAGYGGHTLHAIWRKKSFYHIRLGAAGGWLLAMIIMYAVGVLSRKLLSHGTTMSSDPIHAASVALLSITVLILTWRSWKSQRASTLLIMFTVSALLPWNMESPVTSQWNPSKPVPTAAIIKESSFPNGRVITDTALDSSPLPPASSAVKPHVRDSMVLPARLAYNSPRAWGLRTSGGFSPLESSAMHELRNGLSTPGQEASPEAFTQFCYLTASRWILTSHERAEQITALNPDMTQHYSWGATNKVVLLQNPKAQPAFFSSSRKTASSGNHPKVISTWRLKPGLIRIDLNPGEQDTLIVSETYSQGWTAKDESSNPLEVFPIYKAFIGLEVPEGTTEVRLEYRPKGWVSGVYLFLAGILALLVTISALLRHHVDRIIHSPVLPIIGCVLFFILIGTAARGRWACTYDEGFHLSRGMGRILKNDSRLNYYHPPLQNAACAYFANIAYTQKIRFPEATGWRTGDIQRFATEFTYANRRIFPGMVKASRWGSSIFGVLLCVAGVIWAFRAGGLTAAWLACAGLALNANILTHGNLTTTDMSVTTLVFLASMMSWLYIRTDRMSHLSASGVLFAIASMFKFTGLVWMLAFLILVIPLACIRAGSRKPLAAIPITLASFIVLLVLSYGFDAQTVRVNSPSWISGAQSVGGRYIEGLFRQGSHILSGHRAYFAGSQFYRSSWYHMPMTIIVKHPAVWSLAFTISIGFLAYRNRRNYSAFIPFIPLIVFSIMFVTTNKLALGIRHLLPIIPFVVLATSVAVSNIRSHLLHGTVTFVLIAASALTIIQSYPRFLSYYPLWAGGLERGHYWSVDSNYDWGQDLEDLEEQWASLTKANNGKPPHLLYYGFVDPRVVYGIRATEPSWGGYMQWYSMSRGTKEEYESWRSSIGEIKGPVAASISMLKLRPFGTDLSYITDRTYAGRLNYSYFVYGSGESMSETRKQRPEARGQ